MYKWILLIFSTLLFSCSQNQNSVTIAFSNSYQSLDPALAFDESSIVSISQTVEPLFQYDYLKRPYSIIPQLAESMPKISNDGTSYIIKIKKMIPYHPHPIFNGKTRYVTAQDFVNQFKRVLFAPTKSTGRWTIENRIVGARDFIKEVGDNFDKMITKNIKGIATLDKHTLKIELTRKDPQFLYLLCMSFFTPLPMEILSAKRPDKQLEIVGTGPYILEEKIPFEEIVLHKFKDYRMEEYPGRGDRIANSLGHLNDAGKKIPFLDKIKIKFIKDEKTRLNLMENGTVDIIEIAKSQINNLIEVSGELNKKTKAEGIRLITPPSFSSRWIAFNMDKSLIGKNINFRKAIAHAINYEKLIKEVTGNAAMRSYSIYIPGIPGHSPTTDISKTFNQKLAKKYLIKSGIPKKKRIIKFTTRGNATPAIVEGKLIKKMLEEVGIKVIIEEVNFTTFLNKSRNGELEFWKDGWIYDYPDSENILQLLYSKNKTEGLNKTQFYNKSFDTEFRKFRTMTNIEEKSKSMEKLENIVAKEIPWIPLYNNRSFYLYRDRIKNFRPASFIRNYFKYLNIK